MVGFNLFTGVMVIVSVVYGISCQPATVFKEWHSHSNLYKILVPQISKEFSKSFGYLLLLVSTEK